MTEHKFTLDKLSHRLDALEREVRFLRLLLVRKGILEKEPQPLLHDLGEVLIELQREGLIRSPTQEELEHAAAWDTLPEKEKQAIDTKLAGLHLTPLLSEIIALNRAGRL